MNPPKHIVAVAGLVEDSEGNVLMIRSPHRGWEFPGGQVEQGENLIEALAREVFEETGVQVSVGALVGVYSNVKSHIVMFDFLCQPVSGAPTVSAESLEVDWVRREEALARMQVPVLRDRMRDMLEFDGQVIYRAYEFDAIGNEPFYHITEERRL